MNAQIIYSFTPYKPDHEEQRRLDSLQVYIASARAGMENRIRELPLYWQIVEREKFYSYFRSKIKLINLV